MDSWVDPRGFGDIPAGGADGAGGVMICSLVNLANFLCVGSVLGDELLCRWAKFGLGESFLAS